MQEVIEVFLFLKLSKKRLLKFKKNYRVPTASALYKSMFLLDDNLSAFLRRFYYAFSIISYKRF